MLVEFRKRLTDEIIGEINEMIIEYNTLMIQMIKGHQEEEQPKVVTDIRAQRTKVP